MYRSRNHGGKENYTHAFKYNIDLHFFLSRGSPENVQFPLVVVKCGIWLLSRSM